MSPYVRRWVFCIIAVLSLTACSNPAPAPVVSVPALAWQRLDLPATGGLVLRDVADCDGHWYVTGGLRDAAGDTAPAAWTGTDGHTWTAVKFEPLPASYYGPRDVITSVACAGGLAMVGAVPGGAHGNPRVSTWRLAGGRMVENPAPFETYGGDKAVDVGPIAAGPAGFAIAGNRSSGAAAWFSPDGREFTLVENAPGLADDPGHDTMARDAVALPDGRWAVVGGAAVRDSLDEVAAVWLTSDGKTWSRDDPPAAGGFNEIQRVVRQGDDLVAAGMRGTAFGLWRRHAGAWTAGATFGGDPGGVRSLTVSEGRAVVAGGGGLWLDGRAVAVPGPPVAVGARGDVLLLATEGGLWSARV